MMANILRFILIGTPLVLDRRLGPGFDRCERGKWELNVGKKISKAPKRQLSVVKSVRRCQLV